MTAKTKQHIYPSHILEDALRERGFRVICHWEIKGPKDTEIEWMHYLFASNDEGVYGGMIVQTYKENGWTVYVEPTNKNDTNATIDAVIKTLDHKGD